MSMMRTFCYAHLCPDLCCQDSALAGLAERGIIQEERPPFCRLGYNMTGCLAFVALTRFLSQFCKYELLLPNLQHRCQFWNPGLSICRPCLPLMKVAKA